VCSCTCVAVVRTRLCVLVICGMTSQKGLVSDAGFHTCGDGMEVVKIVCGTQYGIWVHTFYRFYNARSVQIYGATVYW
jgi:hypothetical protein